MAWGSPLAKPMAKPAARYATLGGSTLSLCGPKSYTNKEIADLVFDEIDEESNAITLPRSLGHLHAYAMGFIPGAWYDLDAVRIFVRAFKQRHSSLQALVHGPVDEAAEEAARAREAVEYPAGADRALVANHLVPYLLTQMLLPLQSLQY